MQGPNLNMLAAREHHTQVERGMMNGIEHMSHGGHGRE